MLELADVIAVNKADGPHERDARTAARELSGALRLLRTPEAAWHPPVLTCSAREDSGLEELWEQVGRHRKTLENRGELAARRRDQQVAWVWTMVEDRLLARLWEDQDVRTLAPTLEDQVRAGTLTAANAAEQILGAFGGGVRLR